MPKHISCVPRTHTRFFCKLNFELLCMSVPPRSNIHMWIRVNIFFNSVAIDTLTAIYPVSFSKQQKLPTVTQIFKLRHPHVNPGRFSNSFIPKPNRKTQKKFFLHSTQRKTFYSTFSGGWKSFVVEVCAPKSFWINEIAFRIPSVFCLPTL